MSNAIENEVTVELRSEKRLDQFPGQGRPNCPAADANHVQVVVLDSLMGRKVLVDQRCPNARNLIGANRRADAAVANRHAPVELSVCNRSCERDDEIWIIITLMQGVRTKIDDLMPGCEQLSDQVIFQAETTMVGSDADTHIMFPRS
jgi:hypothetical protein